MSHFHFETEVNDLLRLDGPMNKGPAPRWQRKSTEPRCSTTSTSTTPLRSSSRLNCSKTPSKTPKSLKKTPGKAKTPSEDRFIPNRSAMNFEMNYHKMISADRENDENECLSPSKAEFKKKMAQNMGLNDANSRILAFKMKAPTPREGHLNDLRVLYSNSKTPSTSAKKNSRHISPVPERILDAPDLIDDYYLNLLDWSCNNHLAVALGGFVYLWNAATGNIVQLCQTSTPECYIGSLAWIKEGNYIALGDSDGVVQLWDVEAQKRLRSMAGHSSRVGCLSWNSYILSSGCRSGAIHHHDVRVAHHHVATLARHSQEVCGLKWSPDGKFLASGGNDNLLLVWDASINTISNSNTPLHTLNQHQAAVKALDWCPFQRNVLASGGGTADRHIRFWNVSTGNCLNSIDTHSQVCSILWSNEYKELVSSHGYAQNQLTVWKYPSMVKVTELTGHTCRVLHMAMSPDGQTVVSAAADETLRLWKCFASDPVKKKSKPNPTSSSLVHRGIR
ncbi:Cell division cycle protein 20-like protein [Acropora cervicornis]|uniref:Cell division cycle protein 20-like protein n=1 Tax=Acropora cervicornis TaxID=6130 RepID=A0AAD9QYI0_ACRCE|nr:Cell division cycle protein 20-like protein [Acropora cervicornis]